MIRHLGRSALCPLGQAQVAALKSPTDTVEYQPTLIGSMVRLLTRAVTVAIYGACSAFNAHDYEELLSTPLVPFTEARASSMPF